VTNEKASSKRPGLLLIIISLKFFKSALFIACATALTFFHQESSTRLLIRAADWADGDPRLRLTAHLLRELTASFELHFSMIVLACFLGGAVLAAEGICLWLGYTWAPWLAIVLTGAWVPLEIYEIFRHFHIRTLVVAVINVFIVVYLYDHRKDFHRHLAI
jgi:uncharacterized membrane protein (DUF2068 family)